MLKLTSSRNYIIIKNKKELKEAKECDICGYIVSEENNAIIIYEKKFSKWERTKYVLFDESKDKDELITGLKAYQEFYNYCGKEEIIKMKKVLPIINLWEGTEQLHYCNYDYSYQKIYKDIYEFDANSAFTYGVMQLPNDFKLLKEYMIELYECKKNSTNNITRSKYKNLQNYLIGYFARIKEFVSVRSEIIKQSNLNIEMRMVEIKKAGGICYLSNTDSIITENIGAKVLEKYFGDGIGKFKLATKCDKLYYKSSNAYQIGDKVVYSGVGYFARKHTDFFKEHKATQHGKLIEGFGFTLNIENSEYMKICYVRYGEIEVIVVNSLGEKIDTICYKIGE